MKHPNPDCQRNQEEFLRNCPEGQREFHAKTFRIGNAAFVYHQQTFTINDKRLNIYYQEWLEGLPDNLRAEMKKKGFEACKTVWSFTRYVNERQDYGMGEWMKDHLSAEDYQYYKETKE